MSAAVPATPRRVSFLTARLLVPAAIGELAVVAARLMEHAVWPSLARHPGLSVTDPFDAEHADADGQLWTIDHQSIENKLAWEFGQSRRDEILWLEVGLDPDRDQVCALQSRRRTQPEPQPFEATSAEAPLSVRIQECIDAWLAARGLEPLAHAVPPFAASDVVATTRLVQEAFATAKVQPDAVEALVLQPQGGLEVAYLRLVTPLIHAVLQTDPEAVVRVKSPEDLEARRQAYLAERGKEGASHDALLQLLAEAPGWGKPWLSVHGDAFSEARAVDAQGVAATLMPTNPWATFNYALQLQRVGRFEEAYRHADRGGRASPRFARSHVAALRALRDTLRFGAFCEEALDRREWLMGCAQREELDVHDWPQLVEVGLRAAQAMLDVGRLDEAINIGEDVRSRVADFPRQFQWWHEEIERWHHDPAVLALAYAREAWHRRDPGRVLAGYRLAPPATSSDVAKLVDTLVRVGRAELAPLCDAHFGGSGKASQWPALLEGARAHLLEGDLRLALDRLVALRLRFPQARLDSAVERLLRLGASHPAAAWEDVVREHRSHGALRLAWMVARDAADFVPDMARSIPLMQALGDQEPVAYDRTWLERLRTAFAPTPLAAVDAAFEAHATGGLAAADRLAATWRDSVSPPQARDPTHPREVAWTFAQALCRYFAATTRPPDPVSGGLRQVATASLGALGRMKEHLGWAWIEPLLAALERCAAFTDPWLFDRWLLRLERALDLEHWLGEMLRGMLADKPRVAAALRGDERVAAELRHAHELVRSGAEAATVAELLERCFRAYGTGNPAWELSVVADEALSAEGATDVHWTASVANPTHAVAWIDLARRMFAAGRRELAFDALVHAFPPTGRAWREQRLAELKPLWEQSGLDVPFDYETARTEGVAALEAGDGARAARCLRWCDAIEPGDPVLRRRLGRAWAKQGRVLEALRAFASSEEGTAPQATADALRDAGFLTEALRAGRYASLWYTKSDEWLALARLAWSMEDDETGVEAFGEAHRLATGQLGLDDLNKFATCLYGSGRYEQCEEIAQQMLREAGQHPLAVAFACDAMARSLMGQARHADAAAFAGRAVAAVPDGPNAAAFAETLRRAQTLEPYPERVPADETQEGAALKLLQDGAFGGARQAAAAGRSWRLWRIQLGAAEHRGRDDNHRWVTDAARRVAEQTMAPTAGATERMAALCRAEAMRILEEARQPIDPPPTLGIHLIPQELQARWNDRHRRPAPLKRRVIASTEDFDSEAAVRRARGAAEELKAGHGGDPDPEVFPGQPVARLSQYVAMMKRMQDGDTAGALAEAGLDMVGYAGVAQAWASAMAADPLLAAKFQERMR